MILKGNDADMRELLKYTLFDLIIRKVIGIDEEEKQARKGEKIREIIYIIKGENFENYTPRFYERCFIDALKESENPRIMLQHVAKMVYWDGEEDKDYINKIISQPHTHVFFTRKIWQYIFGGFSLSRKGKHLREEVKTEIRTIEGLLSTYLLEYDTRSEQIVKPIAGNLAHLKKLDPKLSRIVRNNTFLIEFAAFLHIDYSPKYTSDMNATGIFPRP